MNPKKITYIEKKEGEKLPEFCSNIKCSKDDQFSEDEPESDDEEDSNFVDSDYEVEDDDFDLFVDNVVDEECIDQGAGKGKKKVNEDDLMMYDADNNYASTDDDMELPQTAEGKGFKFRTFKAGQSSF
jgi:hypothetical protein